MWVLDPLGVSPGALVRVAISDQGLLVSSLVLYGLPLLALLAGALIGNTMGGETSSFMGAGLGLVASLPLVRLVGNRIPERNRFSARIVKIEEAAGL